MTQYRRLTDHELYYLKSVARNLDEWHDLAGEHVSILGPSIGSEVLADNRNWLDCFIDAEEHAAIKPGSDDMALPRTKAGFDHDGVLRVLGCRDGYLHALAFVEHMISRFQGQYSGRFHPRHTRKIRERDAIVAPMREIAVEFDKSMRDCLQAYQTNKDELDAMKKSAAPGSAVIGEPRGGSAT